MADEVNFLDLVALTKIAPDSVVERFGSLINSSFYDASNILATLKLKGLVDFTPAPAGQSALIVTDAGKQLLSEANEKAKNDFDNLDLAVITQMANGKVAVDTLGAALNLRPRDLALRLYKLLQQQFVSYELRNGMIRISLTESGFLQAKTGMPTKPAAQPKMQETAGVQAGVAPNESQDMTEEMIPQRQQEAARIQAEAQSVQQSQTQGPGKSENTSQQKAGAGSRRIVTMIIILLIILIVIGIAFELKLI